MIAIGACAYLSTENHYLGALLFSIGLLTVYAIDLYLFTGRVAFVFQKKNVLQLLVIWFGNLSGAVITAALIANTKLMTKNGLLEVTTEIVKYKLEDNLLSSFILAVLCGILMVVAALVNKKTKDTSAVVGGYIIQILCVIIFILAGFEHSITNMFYFTLSATWSTDSIIAVLVVSLGNSVGAILFNSIYQVTRLKQKIVS